MDILNEPNNPQNQENNSINSNTHEKKGTFFKKKIIYIFFNVNQFTDFLIFTDTVDITEFHFHRGIKEI